MPDAQQILHDRYRLLEKLGQTAGRQTWLAEDLTHQPAPQVIVKLLAFADQVNWDILKLFEREANILRQLDHPQIPRYRDYFSIDDRILWFGLVQEFIPGTSLKNLLTQGKRFSEKQVCQIATEVLQILIYLHALNPPVFHRDIKPSNLIWGKDKQIHLIDFGAVQDKAAVEGATFTVVGTYGYAPMEQFGGRTVPASDLYALGATLIHLLTGVAPADLPQRNLRIQFADKVNIRPSLVSWLEKLTVPDVTDRYATAKVALTALRSALQSPQSGQAIWRKPLQTLVASAMSALAEPRSVTPTIYQRPANSRVELHTSPQALVIRLPNNPAATFSNIAFGVALLTAGIVTAIVVPVPLISIMLFGGLWVVAGIATRSATVITFRHDYFTHYKEFFFFHYTYRYLVDKVPIAAIQDVIHHDLLFQQGKSTATSRVVSIQTKNHDYVFGRAWFNTSNLSRDECAWLVQEIKRWLTKETRDR